MNEDLVLYNHFTVTEIKRRSGFIKKGDLKEGDTVWISYVLAYNSSYGNGCRATYLDCKNGTTGTEFTYSMNMLMNAIKTGDFKLC